MTASLAAHGIDVGINKKTIVHDLSLEIPEGKITAIIGPNGCGKSTTLKAISRIWPVEKGSITFKGKDIKAFSHREFAQCLAILTQAPTAPTDLTVQDLVEMGRFPHRGFLGRGDKDDAKHVEWALEQTNMTSMRQRLLHTLSGGERQRAWIAMALAQRPQVLLLDEPSAALDLIAKERIYNYFLDCKKKGKILLLATHDVQELSLCDVWYIIKNGKLVPFTYDGNVHTLVGKL